MLKKLSLASALILLTACSTTTDKQIATTVSNLSPCEKVKALVSAYDAKFESIKGTKVNTKYGSVWQAKHHLVGETCAINELSSGKVAYKCSETYDNKQLSDDVFGEAKSLIKSCLGDSWNATETVNGESVNQVFVSSNSPAHIVLATGKTLAKHRKTHFVSLEIGEPIQPK